MIRFIQLMCLVSWAMGAMEKTSIIMKRSHSNDQSMSGSGYSYSGEDGKPAEEYSFELVDGDHGRALRILKDLGYDPFKQSYRYAEEHSPLPYEDYHKEYDSFASEEQPVFFDINEKSHQVPNSKVIFHQVPSYNPEIPHIDSYSKLGIYPNSHKYPYAPGYHHNSNFLRKGGKYYDDFASKKFGDQLDKGYNTYDSFSKGLKGKYDNKDSKSYYDQSGGNNRAFFDKAGNYAHKHAAGSAYAGGSYGAKDHHDKGQKTTGFHKVYHKDDYNKQHKFYDKADQNGHFNKYGDYEAKHADSEGHYAKGGHSDKGYDSDKYANSDFSDKGHFDEIAKGFTKAKGDEGFYKEYEGFGKKEGSEKKKIEGFSF
ncbi:uncharacterized protein LOC126750651 [Anthonomus grandis grandis]|uniref:uncharacterized protein LOC126750651 n=1 Tax=Anthonomus grandis grandis TaxID=2921223 RepID=UPI002165F86F|nr:uncharacterized protein LOC126750651 [Anthonomus grandis grandis]